MHPLPSIHAIARHLGLAPSTVSKVLGPHAERYRIGTETRERILKAAEELGYRPDLRNRARAMRRTGMVGVLYATPSPTTHVVFEHFGTLAAEALARHGCRPCYLPAANWAEVRRCLAEHRVDGCILIPPLPAAATDDRPPESLPMVLVNALADLPVPQVITDDAQGVTLLVDHLVGLGHRRIAYADLPTRPFGHYSETARRQGYQEAMRRQGLEPGDYRGDADGLLGFLDSWGGTAAITYNHQLALDISQRIRRTAIPVPARFSFACASDTSYGVLLDPPWTAIEIPMAAMVDRAVGELMALIEGRTASDLRRIVVPQTLRIRGTTGPAPARA